jgi:hypothetical protein
VSNQDLARVRVGQVSDLGSDLSSELVITRQSKRLSIMSISESYTILSSKSLLRSSKIKVEVIFRYPWSKFKVRPSTPHCRPERQLVGRQRINHQRKGEGRFMWYSRSQRPCQTLLCPQPSSFRNITSLLASKHQRPPDALVKDRGYVYRRDFPEPTLRSGHLRQRFQIFPTSRYFQGLRGQSQVISILPIKLMRCSP